VILTLLYGMRSINMFIAGTVGGLRVPECSETALWPSAYSPGSQQSISQLLQGTEREHGEL
jgi:hypothetical protein